MPRRPTPSRHSVESPESDGSDAAVESRLATIDPTPCPPPRRLAPTWTRFIFFMVTCCLDLLPVTHAHTPEESPHLSDTEGLVQASSKQRWFPAAVVLPAVEGPAPWSEKPVLNDPNRFHIAVVTDRTGGHRPGIWMKGINKINLMRPDFVVSVGDLIEGYSEDPTQIKAEWQEFLGYVNQLDMKFFFVAGNHDLSNPLMHEIWRMHFGPRWYSFDYKGVHFICLCSEDPVSRLGEQQLSWIEADLERNKNARWTLIFLHKPLWIYDEREIGAGNQPQTGWARVEAALGERPRTVFSGHHHSYVQFDRNGKKYYQLATLGGGSRLRGIRYGEFDHFVWLTMESTGPQVTNLMLDGVEPASIVTEKSIVRFRQFLAGSQLEVAPILIADEAGFHSGRIDVRLTNRFDKPISVKGQLDGIPLRGLTLDPDTIQLRAEPGETAKLALTLRFTDKIPYEKLAGTSFSATLTSEDAPPLTAERRVPVVIDRRHAVPRVVSPTIDGRLDEWSDFPYQTEEQPLVLAADELWNGPADASVAFTTAYDDNFVYIAARVTDDARIRGDQFELRIDARPITSRAGDSRLLDGTYHIHVDAPMAANEAQNDASPNAARATIRDRHGKSVTENMIASALATDSGYDVELAIPSSLLNSQQADNWHSFQMLAAVRDVDEAEDEPCRVLWRGTVDIDQRNSGYGHFVRSTK